MSVLFDDDLFDAELILSRSSGASVFYKEDVAMVIDCSPTSVWRFIRRGVLGAPDHYEDMPNGGRRAVWSRDQMVRLIMEIDRRERERDAERN